MVKPFYTPNLDISTKNKKILIYIFVGINLRDVKSLTKI